MSRIMFLSMLFLANLCAAGSNEIAVHEKSKRLAAQLNDNFSSVYVNEPVPFKNESKQIYAVLISLEGHYGGNAHVDYLAVYELGIDGPGPNYEKKMKPSYRLISLSIIGRKMWRDINFNSMQFANETFYFSALKYGPNDSGCCPSEEVKVMYKLTEIGLIEL